MMKENKDKKLLHKRIIAVVSVLVLLGLMGYITYFIIRMIGNKIDSPAAFKDYIDSFGVKGYLVGLGIQILQVFVALIPGEVIEIGLGYAFGWFSGTLICLLGVAIASSAVFLLVKKAGIKVVELFVDTDKINNLRFLNSEKKLNTTVFLLFFIPGTPKDLLTYPVGLTRMTLAQFIGITMVARLPSVMSSVFVGHFAVEEDYLLSAVIFAATAVISLLGVLIYNKLLKDKHKALKEKHHAKKAAKRASSKR
ncbi:MAG: TVP38/TMEM64 family protein [Clostridia bacterium]|nr:TVP38/TMEM64 family protein [Clostridia bacterium]